MMDNNRDRLQENNIVNEVETSFLEYSMSVIVQRALPDLRDGLKPVHRRILYSMYDTGYTPDKKWYKVMIDNGENGYVRDNMLKKGRGNPLPPKTKIYR